MSTGDDVESLIPCTKYARYNAPTRSTQANLCAVLTVQITNAEFAFTRLCNSLVCVRGVSIHVEQGGYWT